MQEILREEFQQQGLPQGWYTDTAYPTYGNGAWDCRKGDGVIITLPHDAWTQLRVEVDISDSGSKATGFCGLDTHTALSLTLGNNPHERHSATESGRPLALSKTSVPAGEPRHLVF